LVLFESKTCFIEAGIKDMLDWIGWRKCGRFILFVKAVDISAAYTGKVIQRTGGYT
jgi:hypothetical protein